MTVLSNFHSGRFKENECLSSLILVEVKGQLGTSMRATT